MQKWIAWTERIFDSINPIIFVRFSCRFFLFIRLKNAHWMFFTSTLLHLNTQSINKLNTKENNCNIKIRVLKTTKLYLYIINNYTGFLWVKRSWLSSFKWSNDFGSLVDNITWYVENQFYMWITPQRQMIDKEKKQNKKSDTTNLSIG